MAELEIEITTCSKVSREESTEARNYRRVWSATRWTKFYEKMEFIEMQNTQEVSECYAA